MAKKEYSEDIKRNLKVIVDHFDAEDREVRDRQMRTWKKLKCYWDGFTNIWWSETAHDWRVYDLETASENGTGYDEYYEKNINVFRAYLESIIAALSVSIPGIICTPDDADNPEDIETARAGNNIAKLVSKHNDVSLLWMHALYVYCTEGMIACYNYTKESEDFGTYEVEEYEEVTEEQVQKICPLCMAQVQDKAGSDLERAEFDPGYEDIISQGVLSQTDTCASCLQVITPVEQKEQIVVPRFTGITNKPKSRQCMEVYGGLYVKIPLYAMRQEEMPYLIFAYETHFANVLEMYPDMRENLTDDGRPRSARGSSFDNEDRSARLSTQYRGTEPRENLTVRNTWLRPSSFNLLSSDEEVKELKKEFPFGVKVVFVADHFAEACPEKLDDHWTLSKNPLSDYLHHEPLGASLTSIQEITTDLVSLVQQTIEHGIPQTFADPGVLSFPQYEKLQASPGMMIPATPKAGKSVGDAFHEIKTATLSGEVLPFADRIQQLGQLASGAQPSLFGGQMEGSKTASEYSMARAQSLQRLQIGWKMLTMWWKNIYGKVIPAYIKSVAHDERMVEKDTSGNFINVFVRRAQLNGKIGSVELEAAEDLPTSWAMKKEAWMQLIQLNNPEIMSAILTPENMPALSRAFGVEDFKIPGEDDREKQNEEIKILLQTEPTLMLNEMTGEPEEAPSVDIEPLIDNNELHSDVCRKFLVSPAGRLAKYENPEGYKNVLLHMQRHVQVVQAMMAMNAANSQSGENDPNAAENAETENVN
jgi:hypothetical protein